MKSKTASNEINFYVGGDKPVEIIKISKGKFYWKGEEVKDKYQIYERFNDWLKMVETEEEKEDI